MGLATINEKESKQRQCIFLLSIFLIVGVLVSFYYLLWKVTETSSEPLPTPDCIVGHLSENICYSKECIQAAAKLLSNMDMSVNPCDNFYKFACGNYEKNSIIPPDKPLVSPFSELTDLLDFRIWHLLEEPIQQNESLVFKMTREYYQSCMDTTHIENSSVSTLHQLLKSVGGWPMLEGDSWNESAFNWMDSLYKFRNLGFPIDSLLTVEVVVDHKNNSQRLLRIDEPTFLLLNSYLSESLANPDVRAYRQFQMDVAIALGADIHRAETETFTALLFESKLATATLEGNGKPINFSTINKIMTLDEMQEQWDYIPWAEFLNNILSTSEPVPGNERVAVSYPEYFNELGNIIQLFDKRAQANYLVWRAVLASIPYLSEKFRKAQLDLLDSMEGVQQLEPRWKDCLHSTLLNFPNAVGALYVRKYFQDHFTKAAASDLFNHLKNASIHILEESNWMHATTKNRAVAKIRKLSSHIGYPIELLDNEKLEKYYDGLHANKTDYLLNWLNLSKFYTDYAFKKLHHPVNKTDWSLHAKAVQVNAHYSRSENTLDLPASMLQGAFYNKHLPKYLNYGSIGTIIGHELTHALDDKGRQFNEDGNLENWWDHETYETFVRKMRCILKQYSRFIVPEFRIRFDGLRTLTENVADNGGVKKAYRAYQNWLKHNGPPEPRLPGLAKYTGNQMFWIGSASVWCSKSRNKTREHQILKSVHSPGEFRVQGVFSNLKEFSQDFNCPAGSNMNPNQKCVLW